MIGAPFPSAAQAPWSGCPRWKTDPMLENRDIKNPKSISDVSHSGLALLFFLIKTFHILALLSSQRRAGSLLRTAPHRERRQRRACPVWGCFPHAAPACRALRHKAPSKSSWHHSWPPLISTREPLMECSIFFNAESSRSPLLQLAHGYNSQLPLQSPAQPRPFTWPSHPRHHSRPRGGCGHPFCSLVLGVLPLSHSINK